MIKNKVLRFGFLAVVLVMLAIGAFAFSVNTHAAAPSASASTTAHVSILREKVGVVFGKTAITVTHGTPFQFTNRTNTPQSVTLNGKTILTMPAKSSAPYTWKKAGTFTYSLMSNSSATLAVTVQ